MGHIFISYSRKDENTVKPIYNRLHRVYNLWMDTRNIDGGATVDDVIRTQIRSASALVAMVSADSIKSNWVSGEVNEALAHNIHVIPYVIDPTQTLPIPLQGKNAHFASTPGAEGQLMDSLLAAAPDARVHPGKTMTVTELARHRRTTFSTLAAQTMGAITTPKDNIGIPLKLSRHHTAYLFGHPNSTLESPDVIQVAFQLSAQMPNHSFVDDILRHAEKVEHHEKPYVLVIRSPRKSPDTVKSGEGDNYSMDVHNPDEWSEVIHLAYQVVNEYFGKPRLELFMLGPSILLFQLGTKLRDLLQVDGFHFDRDAKPEPRYFKVFSSP